MIWTSLLDNQSLDLKLKDENGRSALHVACWYNKVLKDKHVFKTQVNNNLTHLRRQQYQGF